MRTADDWPIAANMLSFGSRAADGTPNVDAPAESWRRQLQEVADLGFAHVDPTDAWLSLGELGDARFREFAEVVRDVGLAVPSISMTRSSVIDAERGDEHLAFAHTIIERTPELGAEVVNVGFMQALTPAQQDALWFWLEPGHVDDVDDAELRAEAVRRIRELADHATDAGIQLSLEMYEDTFVGTPDLAIRFLEEVDRDNVGLNPDLGNLVRLHRPIEDIPQMFEKVLPHSNFWHIKNYTRDFDPATGAYATHPTPLVQGVVNYRTVIRRALEVGFDGVFVCEHYGSDSLGVAAINREYIRGVLRGAGR